MLLNDGYVYGTELGLSKKYRIQEIYFFSVFKKSFYDYNSGKNARKSFKLTNRDYSALKNTVTEELAGK